MGQKCGTNKAKNFDFWCKNTLVSSEGSRRWKRGQKRTHTKLQKLHIFGFNLVSDVWHPILWSKYETFSYYLCYLRLRFTKTCYTYDYVWLPASIATLFHHKSYSTGIKRQLDYNNFRICLDYFTRYFMHGCRLLQKREEKKVLEGHWILESGQRATTTKNINLNINHMARANFLLHRDMNMLQKLFVSSV